MKQKLVTMSFKIDMETKLAAQAYAKSIGVSLSWVIRKALEELIANPKDFISRLDRQSS